MARNSTNSSNRKALHRLELVVNSLVIAAALSILIGYIVYFVTNSFSTSVAVGLRSVAAAALPFAIISYIGFFTPLLRTKHSIPAFNLYFVFSLWSLFLLGLVSNLNSITFHLGELLFSITLAATTWRYRCPAFKLFVSCCYGIVTGALIHSAFWGLP